MFHSADQLIDIMIYMFYHMIIVSTTEAYICPQSNQPCPFNYCRAVAELFNDPAENYQEDLAAVWGERIGGMTLASTYCTLLRTERLEELAVMTDDATARDEALAARTMLLTITESEGQLSPLELLDEEGAHRPTLEQVGVAYHELLEEFASADKHAVIRDGVAYIAEALADAFERLDGPEGVRLSEASRVASLRLGLELALYGLSAGEYTKLPRYLSGPIARPNPQRQMTDRAAGGITDLEPIQRSNYLRKLKDLAFLAMDSPAHLVMLRSSLSRSRTSGSNGN